MLPHRRRSPVLDGLQHEAVGAEFARRDGRLGQLSLRFMLKLSVSLALRVSPSSHKDIRVAIGFAELVESHVGAAQPMTSPYLRHTARLSQASDYRDLVITTYCTFEPAQCQSTAMRAAEAYKSGSQQNSLS